MAVIKHPAQRVGVFIDTQNLYQSAKHLYKTRVNFAYVISTETGEEKNFFEALTKIGIETKVKDLQVFADGVKKADWDVGLAIDAVKPAPKLDTVVLATGDGDFIPLIQYLDIKEGCQVEVISFGKSSSGKLKEAAHAFTDMCDDPRKYTITTRG